MDRILGQPHAIEVLRAALRSQRVHHAWIFSGPLGVGKFTTAVEFARLLLDPDAAPTLTGEIESDPHSACSLLIDAGTHPDLHIIRKELARFSDDRQLREKKLTNMPLDVLRENMIGGRDGGEAPAYRTAMRGHGKVFIIDEAELLENTAQNAMLKTLEEPPAETFIILITSRPERLLPTIRSRCQHVRFTSLDDCAMQAWVTQAKLDCPREELEWIIRFADGSPGVALIAAEYGFASWDRTLAPMLTEIDRGRFPVAMGETLAALVEEFAVAWVKKHDNASKDAANKDGLRHVLSLLATHARRNLLQDPYRASAMIDAIRETESQAAANVNLKMVLENLSSRWAQSHLLV
ncbi:MAG TPA: AAA family ATPase [Phycisphaerales bacterium]|nr:AAA family ATPase [Phycisphaerales bacterium]HRQ76835.1 AAA family ATPase [Phycisphaerales bacterium]